MPGCQNDAVDPNAGAFVFGADAYIYLNGAERLVEQHRSNMESGNDDVYKPFVAVAVTGAALGGLGWSVGQSKTAVSTPWMSISRL